MWMRNARKEDNVYLTCLPAERIEKAKRGQRPMMGRAREKGRNCGKRLA